MGNYKDRFTWEDMKKQSDLIIDRSIKLHTRKCRTILCEVNVVYSVMKPWPSFSTEAIFVFLINDYERKKPVVAFQ